MPPKTNRKLDEDTLRLIYDGTAGSVGEEFFNALVCATARAMGVRWAFVSEFATSRERVRTIAFWDGDDLAENVEYELDGTVCETVLSGELKYYPKEVARKFPREPALVEMGIESYLATPMTAPSGEVLGHLAVFDQKPMTYSERELEVFRVFGARAAAELARKRAEDAVEKSERRLANILETAKDAIITLGADYHIVLFNSAAEQIFRCAADRALGQPFDDFLSQRFRKLFRRFVDDTGEGSGQVWVPEGVTAVRADGDEFAIELTLSSFRQNGEVLYTLILRDISERERARHEIQKLHLENVNLREEYQRHIGFAEMVGESPVMQAVFEQIRIVAPTDASVLLVGETGTGKELVAKALHEQSGRTDNLLVCVNCAALPGELVESELFGHEKGAFTGATTQRKGRFEISDGGTIFLDEIGELSGHAQAKLLRVLQEQTFERVGGTKPLQVNVRVITATNRDLGKMVGEDSFRADLYYRLNVFPIRIPPLRDRRQDIPLLARYFLEKMGRKLGREFRDIDKESMEKLLGYSWPGNVRELQNVIERAAILAHGPVVPVGDMVFSQPPEFAVSTPESSTLDAVQKAHILEVMDQCNWQVEGRGGAAAALGLKPSTLRYRMQKLGIEKQARH